MHDFFWLCLFFKATAHRRRVTLSSEDVRLVRRLRQRGPRFFERFLQHGSGFSVKGLILSSQNQETMSCAIDPYYGNLH